VKPKRQKVESGVTWEQDYGYSRAVRVGTRIHVSGTTATGRDGVVAPGDAAGQTRFILDKIETAITKLGGRLEDVVRTRIYVKRIEDWQAVASVHGERFRHIQPANTLVQARLVGDEYMVEIEAEAEVGSGEGGD
jgi:enamine deaminase RidA (YjgF/YER057c/UK114 family)